MERLPSTLNSIDGITFPTWMDRATCMMGLFAHIDGDPR